MLLLLILLEFQDLERRCVQCVACSLGSDPGAVKDGTQASCAFIRTVGKEQQQRLAGLF